MKETLQEVTDAVQLLWNMSAKYDRGQTIFWTDIEAIAGDRNTNRGKHVINKWRRQLKRKTEDGGRGIVTLVSNTVGVRLLTHLEAATEIPRLRQGKAYRQIRRALRETSLVNTSGLPVHSQKLLASQRMQMAEQRRALFRSQKESRNGVVKTEVNPRRKVVA